MDDSYTYTSPGDWTDIIVDVNFDTPPDKHATVSGIYADLTPMPTYISDQGWEHFSIPMPFHDAKTAPTLKKGQKIKIIVEG